MKALGKLVGLLLLGLLLGIVVLGFVLSQLLDPNDYKDDIRQLARERAGLELDIRGDIGWSLFPWLGLELHDTSLASVRTPDERLADLRLLGLSVRVLPLLRREIRMRAIRLDGLDLTLVRDAQGRGNWEGLGQPAGATPPADRPATPASDSPAARRAVALDIESLTVSDARVSYRDAREGREYSADNVQLSTRTIREGAPIPVTLNARFGRSQPPLQATVALQGTVRFDNGRQLYQLEGLRLSGELAGAPFGEQVVSYSAQGELQADLAAQTAEWRALAFNVNQLRGLGELQASDLRTAPRVAGTLTVAEFNLAEFLQGIGLEPPAMAASDALHRAELVTRLTGTANSLALQDLTLRLDGSRFAGQLAVEDFATQALRVTLNGDRLDLDRYLPPPEPEAADSARRNEVAQSTAIGLSSGSTPLPEAPTQLAWSTEQSLPLERLRRLDARLALDVGLLTLHRLPFENVALRASGTDGVLQLDALRASVHGGGVQASGRLDARPERPILAARGQLVGVPVERLQEAWQKPVVLQGLLALDTDLSTQGLSPKDWVDNLDGDLRFVVDNGVLVQANLEQQICRAIATFNRKTLDGEPRGRDTPFRELAGSLKLQDGVATNPDFQASLPGITVNGSGTLDMRVLGMDYRIGVIVEGDKRDMPDPACQVNERYVGLEWPLRCRGPLELGARACRIDQDGLGRLAARLAGERLNEKLEQQLGDRVDPQLKDAIKGLFNR